MSQSNDILEPWLVAVDSYYLSVISDRIQDLSNDSKHLVMVPNTINTDNNASKGVIVAVRSALFAISENTSKLSASIIQPLILLSKLEVSSYVP